MENLGGRKFIVPIKSLKEVQNLPPQWLFDNAQGVLASHLAVKIKPKNQLLKMVTSKAWKSLPVYLVINYGYIFVYTKREFGYAVNVRASGVINILEDIKKEKPFNDQILIPFKHAELKLKFEDSKAYDQWVHLLQGIVHPEVDREWLKNEGLKLAGYVFSQKEQVIAERVDPPVGQKKDSDWAEVRRYPANTKDINATVFEETILQYEVTFSPGRSSTRVDEYEFELEDDDLDAGSEVFEEQPNFSLDPTDGNEEELSTAASFLNRTPSTRSSNRAVLAQPPTTRRSPSSAPSIRNFCSTAEDDGSYQRDWSGASISHLEEEELSAAAATPSISRSPSTRRSPSLRSQAPVESFDETSLLPDEIYRENISFILSRVSPRSTVADSRVHPAFRSPSISRTPSTRRSPSRAPSLRSEARVPASPFSLPYETFSESNEDCVLHAHPSPSPAPTLRRAPTPAISRTPSRASTPRRARTPSRAPTPRRVAAATLSEDSESLASDGPSYVPSEDSQGTATSSLRALQARTSFHAPQTLRRSERKTKKPERYGYGDGKK